MKKALQVTLIIFVLIGALWWPQLTQANFEGSLGSVRKDRHSQLLMCSSAEQQWTTVLQRSWAQKSALFRWKMKVFILTNPYHEESFSTTMVCLQGGSVMFLICDCFRFQKLRTSAFQLSCLWRNFIGDHFWFLNQKTQNIEQWSLVFKIIQRSHVKDASFYSLQHPCTLAQVTCTECQKWRNMLSWGVRLELCK